MLYTVIFVFGLISLIGGIASFFDWKHFKRNYFLSAFCLTLTMMLFIYILPCNVQKRLIKCNERINNLLINKVETEKEMFDKYIIEEGDNDAYEFYLNYWDNEFDRMIQNYLDTYKDCEEFLIMIGKDKGCRYE